MAARLICTMAEMRYGEIHRWSAEEQTASEWKLNGNPSSQEIAHVTPNALETRAKISA